MTTRFPCVAVFMTAAVCVTAAAAPQSPAPAPTRPPVAGAPTQQPPASGTPTQPQSAGAPAVAAPALAAAQTPAAIAHAVIDAMAAGAFASVVDRMTPTMKAALDETRLRATWTGLVTQAGALRRQGAERVTPNGALQIVVIPCEFERAPLDFQIVIDAAGLVAGMRIAPGTPTVAYTPPSYARAEMYSEQDVTVGTGTWALPATLTVPAGAGPFPAVVLVHGSGPNDRDESVGVNKPFRDLALGLASKGIAVLRYEKRTRQHAAQLMALRDFTVKLESIDDAAIAVDLLRTTPKIDPRRVVVLGHSLGGMLIPRIASAAPRAAGFIVMAGSARPLEQAIVEQAKYLAQLDGTIVPAEQAAIDQAEQLQAAVKAVTATSPAVGGAPASYWLDLRGYDAPVAAKAVTRPMLILQGERDYQVTTAEYARWQAELAASRTATFHLYPGLNHLFITGTGPGNPGEYNTPGHVSEDVIRDIAAWVMALPPLAS